MGKNHKMMEDINKKERTLTIKKEKLIYLGQPASQNAKKTNPIYKKRWVTDTVSQQLPSCSSSYQSCTSDHLPAAAATSPAPVTIFLQQQLLSCTSSYQHCTSDYLPTVVTIFLQQQLPSCTSCYQSYNSNYQSWRPMSTSLAPASAVRYSNYDWP